MTEPKDAQMTDTLVERLRADKNATDTHGRRKGWIEQRSERREAADRIIALEADVARLREAILDHNDALRSANSIAAREGAQTNWTTFREKCFGTLKDYHGLTNQIRKDAGEPVYAALAALEARNA